MTSIEKLFEQLEEQGIVFKSANNLLHISIDATHLRERAKWYREQLKNRL
jgi:hypothetical protein